MLLQTNSYIVPKEKRAEHSRLIRRFRQTLLRLGCDHFEVYEQVGSNWSNGESAGRYVQILRFLDRKHQLAVQAAERTDPTAQAVIADFCELINFPYQQQQGLFAVGFYTSVLPVAPKRGARGELVSTVEHEIIDDPEAEKPYPGSSDSPPLDEAGMPAEASGLNEGMDETQFIDEPSVGEPMAEHAHGKAQDETAFTEDEFAMEPLKEDEPAPLRSFSHAESPSSTSLVEEEELLEPLIGETYGKIERAAEFEELSELEPEELEPSSELLPEAEDELLPAHEPDSEIDPIAALEPSEEYESENHAVHAPEPEAGLETLSEPDAEPHDAEPEELEPVAHTPPPPPAVPSHLHAHEEDSFESLLGGEISEEDEERALGFIEGELVDDLENDHLNGLSGHSNVEELTGHEVPPKRKNAPSPW